MLSLYKSSVIDYKYIEYYWRLIIIYKYSCNRCNSIYTSRHLSTRITEHQGKSFRTGLKLTSPPFSQIRNHIEEILNNHFDYNIKMEEFTILISVESNCNSVIKKSVLIKATRPELNNI